MNIMHIYTLKATEPPFDWSPSPVSGALFDCFLYSTAPWKKKMCMCMYIYLYIYMNSCCALCPHGIFGTSKAIASIRNRKPSLCLQNSQYSDSFVRLCQASNAGNVTYQQSPLDRVQLCVKHEVAAERGRDHGKCCACSVA